MAVNPLDLQVNFTQINQVSKQQATLKEGEVLRQDELNKEIQKDGEKNAEEVPETKHLPQGSGKIKDQEKKKSPKKDEKSILKSKKEDNKEEENEKDEKKNEIDPNLGRNIDILG